jgi:hypothetical protein
VLVKLDSTNIWSFGAGLGPTDAQYMQLVSIRACAGFLLSDSGAPDATLQSAFRGSENSYGEWPKILSVLPSDDQGLLQMLQQQKPAVRWLGLHKAAFLRESTPALTKAIEDIARGDPYVIIEFIPAKPTNGLPPTPDLGNSGFVAPLREKAKEVLKRWGRETALDAAAVDKLGVARLKKLSMESPKHHADVLEAIKLLRGNSNVTQLIQSQVPATAAEQKIIEDFKNAARRP